MTEASETGDSGAGERRLTAQQFFEILESNPLAGLTISDEVIASVLDSVVPGDDTPYLRHLPNEQMRKAFAKMVVSYQMLVSIVEGQGVIGDMVTIPIRVVARCSQQWREFLESTMTPDELEAIRSKEAQDNSDSAAAKAEAGTCGACDCDGECEPSVDPFFDMLMEAAGAVGTATMNKEIASDEYRSHVAQLTMMGKLISQSARMHGGMAIVRADLVSRLGRHATAVEGDITGVDDDCVESEAGEDSGSH